MYDTKKIVRNILSDKVGRSKEESEYQPIIEIMKKKAFIIKKNKVEEGVYND